MIKPIIRVKNLTYSYTKQPVLTDVHFELKKKQSMTIYGSNGSGKSTLLRLLLGELKARENTVFISGEDATKKKDWRMWAMYPSPMSLKILLFL